MKKLARISVERTALVKRRQWNVNTRVETSTRAHKAYDLCRWALEAMRQRI